MHTESPRAISKFGSKPGLSLSAAIFVAALGLAAAGCRNFGPPLPAVNLKEPGWTVREGQAVWRRKGAPGLAGEVLVATRPDGRAFVQFSKTPFPIINAQSSAERWEAQFPAQNKHYSGPGKPPKHLIWLYLPRLLSGQPPPRHWTWSNSEGSWAITNGTTGESLEGFFADAGE
jgi:hypothetical protein